MIIHELIIRYLMKNRRVALSGLGTFSNEPSGASIHPIIHEFRPPHSILLFEENPSCETTQEFIALCSQETTSEQADTLQLIKEFVDSVNDQLKVSGKASIDQFGVFQRTPDHRVEFEADETLMLRADSFGMPWFTLPQRGEQAAETTPVFSVPEAVEEHIPAPVEEDIPAPVEEHIPAPIEEPAPPTETQAEPEPQQTDVQLPDTEPARAVHQDEEDKSTGLHEEIPADEELPAAEIAQEPQMEIAQQQMPDAPPPPAKRKKRIPVWIILLFVILGGSSALYFTGYWEVLYSKAKDITGTQQTATADNETVSAQTLPEDTITAETDETIPDTSTIIDTFPEDVAEADQSAGSNNAVNTTTSDALLKYFIVADCFSNISLAEKRVKALQAEGYNSSIAGQTKQGLHIVTYGGYADKASADKELQAIRNNVKKEAWLYIR